jgi:flagellar protein FliO/FliZ
MQTLLNKLGLGEGAGAMALWLGLGIILLIVVISFGTWLLRTLRPSLNMGGQGRAGRPQRLAITDAFNLDRDGRKLVIIRRDNVEHLLLIGGTNDVVIETSIIKGERSSRNRQTDMDLSTLPDPVMAEAPRVLEPTRPQASTTMPAQQPAQAPATGSPPPSPLAQPPQSSAAMTGQAPQIRIPAALVAQPGLMPYPAPARPAENMVATREGVPSNSSNPAAAPPVKLPAAQQATRPAAPAMPENPPKPAQPAPAAPPARSFEDEFERAMSVSIPPVPHPFSTPAQQAISKPANSQPASPQPGSPPPTMPSPAPRAEPASEMAKRLNEVLQRPMGNAARTQPVVNAPPPPPPLAEKPGAPPPQAQDMDLLEEEMARLLGRVGAPPGKS